MRGGYALVGVLSAQKCSSVSACIELLLSPSHGHSSSHTVVLHSGQLHPDFCTCAGNDGGDGRKDGGGTAQGDDGEDEHLEVHNSDSVFTKVCIDPSASYVQLSAWLQSPVPQ